MKRHLLLAPIVLGALAGAHVAGAADETEEKPPGPWTTATELSLVMTDGNSSVQSFGFKGTLQYKTKQGRSRLRIDSLRSDTSDDPYLLVESGLTFQPGEPLSGYETTAVRPGSEPDVYRFFAEGRYEGNLPKNRTWNAGASWDRNEDAGILSRTIVFGGLGHAWCDHEDRVFRTNYGLSYTDRVEDIDDPEKDPRFLGARLSWDFMDKWGKATKYDNDLTFNVALADLQDYNVDLVQGLSVSMSQHLSLKISLQWTYAGEPALEEVDVIVRARLIDPDGIAGNGDEYFETLESGGTEITIGTDYLRKKQLDTTFRTSLQFEF